MPELMKGKRGLVMGVAGATSDRTAILVAGLVLVDSATPEQFAALIADVTTHLLRAIESKHASSSEVTERAAVLEKIQQESGESWASIEPRLMAGLEDLSHNFLTGRLEDRV